MLVLQQRLIRVGMALLALLLAGIDSVPRCDLRERRTPIPPVIAKGSRRQEVARDGVTDDNPHHQQEDAEKLRRHLEKAAHSSV